MSTRMNKVLNHDEVMAAAEDEMFGMGNLGYCLECGYEQDGCEPDAREYECESCGKLAVMGAAEIILGGLTA